MSDPQLDNILPPEGSIPPSPPVPPAYGEVTPPPPLEGNSVLAASEYVQEQQKNRRGPGLFIAAVVFLLLALLGGAVFAAYRGYIDLPFISSAPTLGEVFANLDTVQTARIGSKLSIALTERRPGTVAVSFLTDEQQTDDSLLASAPLLGGVPADFSGNIETTVDVSRNMESPEGEMSLKGSFTTEGLSAELSGRALFVGDNVFVRADIIPPIISTYLGAIKNKWIKTPVGEEGTAEKPAVFKMKSQLNASQESSSLNDKLEGKMDPVAEMVLMLSRAEENGTLSAPKPTKVVDSLGRDTWQYEMNVDVGGLIALQNELFAQRSELFPDIETFLLFDKEWTQPKDSPNADSGFADQIMAAMNFDLFVDRASEIPVAYAISASLASELGELPSLDEKQLDIISEFTLDQINQPVAVVAPEEYMTWADAVQSTSGISVEDQLMRDQGKIISDLRRALDRYLEVNGAYPTALSELMNLEIPSRFAANSVNPDIFTEVVVSVPNDLYTNQPFNYSLDEAGNYRLVYEMQVPQLSSYTDRYKFAQGTNTATPDDLSLEGIDNPAVDPDAERPVTTPHGTADTERIVQTKQVQTALELYFADYGRYPVSAGTVLGTSDTTRFCDAGWQVNVCEKVTFMSVIKPAPEPPGDGCSVDANQYRYTSDGSWYALTFCTGKLVGDLAAGFHVADPNGIDDRPLGEYDVDFDGLTYDEEIQHGTDPRNPDSDGDGFLDGQEVTGGYNPLGQ